MAGIAAIVFLLSVHPASAGVVSTYNDRAEWETLSGTQTDIDFESWGGEPGPEPGNKTVTENGNWFLYLANPPVGDAEDFLSGARLRGPGNNGISYLLAVFPPLVNAFGIDLASGAPAAASFRIELDGIDVGLIIPTQPRPNRTFFGVLTDTPFSQVKIYVTTGTAATHGLFDNISFVIGATQGGGEEEGPTGETPEVATFLSLGSGLLLFGLRRRKRAQV
jgi:hypothetical protein